MVSALHMYPSCYILFLHIRSQIQHGKEVLQTLPVLDICAPLKVKVSERPYTDP